MICKSAVAVVVNSLGLVLNAWPVLADNGYNQAQRDIQAQQAAQLQRQNEIDQARQLAEMLRARINDIRVQKMQLRKDLAAASAHHDDPHYDYRQIQSQINNLDHQESMLINRLDQIRMPR